MLVAFSWIVQTVGGTIVLFLTMYDMLVGSV